jgi:hypothetical protein
VPDRRDQAHLSLRFGPCQCGTQSRDGHILSARS